MMFRTVPLSRRVAAFAAVMLSLATLPAAAAGKVLRVPHPELDALKPDVRAALAPAVERFRRDADRFRGTALGDLYGQLGMHYQAHELQEPARICYANAMSLDPDNPRWPYYLAVYHEETGGFAEAAVLYQRSLDLAPDNVAGATRLGLLSLSAGNSEAAGRLLQTVVDLEPENAAALAGLAGIAQSAGEHEKAVLLYRKALASQPEADQLHYRLALAYRSLGRVDEARSEMARQGQRIPSIADPLLALVSARKHPAEYYAGLGNRAMQAGDMQRAVRAFGLGLSVNPDSVPVRLGLGRAFGALDQIDKAIEQFDQVIAMDAGNAGAYLYRGGALELKGNHGEAEAAFGAAVRIEPQNPQARLALANSQMRTGAWARAAANYAQLIDAGHGSVEVSYRRGLAALADGNCGDAEPALLAAHQADRRAARVIQALARLYATCPQIGDDKRASALAWAQVLYNGEPGLETAETLAMALAANGRFQDAEDLQMQAIFEATKSGVVEARPQLRDNLERYRGEQPASRAWPSDHAVFRPPLLGGEGRSAGAGSPAS